MVNSPDSQKKVRICTKKGTPRKWTSKKPKRTQNMALLAAEACVEASNPAKKKSRILKDGIWRPRRGRLKFLLWKACWRCSTFSPSLTEFPIVAAQRLSEDDGCRRACGAAMRATEFPARIIVFHKDNSFREEGRRCNIGCCHVHQTIWQVRT